MLVQGLKITFRIPRPWIRSLALHPVESVIDTATGYSFPSGHAQTGTALYGMLAIITKKTAVRILCIFLIFGVAFSRMYLGVHTLQDVSTSVILTGIILVIVYQVSRVKFTNRIRTIVAAVIGLVSAGLLAYSLTLYSNGVIELTYATDSCNASFAGLGLSLGWYLESCWIQFSVKAQGLSLQILKFIIGIAITITIKLALGEILGPTIFGEGILNFTLILWIMVFYPLIIKKVFSVKSKV
jgi:undecaprenyl-diphosphatase